MIEDSPVFLMLVTVGGICGALTLGHWVWQMFFH